MKAKTGDKMKKGTRVRITIGRKIVEGTVISASNWQRPNEDKPDWYIEFTDLDGEYRYYKQSFDGGTVEFDYIPF